MPTGEEPVAGTPSDFTAGPLIGPMKLDTAYTDLAHGADGRARAHLGAPGGTSGVTLWVDASFRYLMVFTGDTVEPASRRRKSVAIEPMTCPPDALRTGRDLIRLGPDNSWRGTWGLTPE